MKNGKQNTNHRTSFFRLLTAFMLVAWTTTFSWSQIANAPCNLESPWIQGVGPGTYTNLEAKINDNVFSLLPPCAGSVSNVGNLIDGNLNNFAQIDIIGIGCNATIGVRDKDAADTYPAGTFAGFNNALTILQVNRTEQNYCTSGCNDNTFTSSSDPNTLEYDNIVSLFHTTMVKEINGDFKIWGQVAAADGTSHNGIPKVVNASNGYNYTGTPLKMTGGSDNSVSATAQMALLSSDGLFIWGTAGYLVSTTIKNSKAMGTSPVSIGTSGIANGSNPSYAKGLPYGVQPEDVKMLFGSYHTLALVTCTGDAWVLSYQGSKNGDGTSEGGSNNNVWHRVIKSTTANGATKGDTLRNVVAIRGTSNALFALTADSTLYTWGSGTYNNTSATALNRTYATNVTYPTGVVPKMIGMTQNGTSQSYYLLATDGRLFSMGNNGQRQLGDFTNTTRTQWVQAKKDASTAFDSIVWISPNEHDNHGVAAINAINSNKKLYAWGNNDGKMIGGADNGTSYDPIFMPGSSSNSNGLSVNDEVIAVETGGHISINVKQCSQYFGYVGHKVNGSMGDDPSLNIPSMFENIYSYSTAIFNLCGAPTSPDPIQSQNLKTCIGDSVNLNDAILSTTPPGFTLEWWTTSNRQAGTQVANPLSQYIGTYYAFYIPNNSSPCPNPTPATITVTADATNCIKAINDTFAISDGQSGGTTSSVLNNDLLDGNPATTLNVNLYPGTPSYPSLVMNPDGTITVASGTAPGTYSYPYTICELANPSNCDTGIASVTVEFINTTFAVNDANITWTNTPVSGDVMTNDYDLESDAQVFQSFLKQDGSGTPVVLDGNGEFVVSGTDLAGNPVANAGKIKPDGFGGYDYTPAAGFNGKVSVPYAMEDNNSAGVAKDTAYLQFTVSPPLNGANSVIAQNDEYFTFGDPVQFNLLQNDGDPQGDNFNVTKLTYLDNNGILQSTTSLPGSPLTVSGVDENGNVVVAGTVTLNAAGALVFTPNGGFKGKVTLNYEITDDNANPAKSNADVVLIVGTDNNGVNNDPPFAGDDFATTTINQPVSGNFFGNDDDPNGDAINMNDGNGNHITINPANPKTGIRTLTTVEGGTVEFFANGTFDYTPPTGYTGPDKVVYEICDVSSQSPGSMCSYATIYLGVGPDPCDYDPAGGGTPSDAWAGMDCDGDGVTNGQELTDGTDPKNPCSYNAAHQVYANTTAAWKAMDCDSDGMTNAEEITGVNDPSTPANPGGSTTDPKNPDTDGDGVTDGDERTTNGPGDPLTDANNPCSFNVAEQGTPGAAWNAADCDGDGVTNGNEITNGGPGDPVTNPLDPCSYNTAEQVFANTTAAWKALDCDGDGNPNGGDPDPKVATARDDAFTAPFGGPTSYNILANDDFLANDGNTITKVGGTAGGTVAFNPVTGDMTYTPLAGEVNSTVTVVYEVCQGAVCDQATVTITVPAAGDSDGDGDPDNTDPEPNNPCVWGSTHTPTVANTSAAWKAGDCDGDGVTNGNEIASSGPGDPATNPLDPCNYNVAEQVIANTSAAWKAMDCDNDGLDNGEETTGLDNPLTPANPGGSTTDPKNPDTDGDGVTDGDERTSNGPGDPLTDANNPCSFNVAEQGTPGAAWNAADCDGDGVTNGNEITNGGPGDPVTNPLDPCSYNTAEQVFANTTAAWKALDCDGDGNPNGGDPDPKVATARDDAFTAPYGAPTAYNILANDDFLANDGNIITKVGGTAGGTVTFNPVTGDMTYAPLFSEIGNTVTVVYEVCQGVVCDQATATINVTDVALQLNLKALLQGAYNTGTGLMRDDLRVKSLIPLTQPYGDAAYSDLAYSGTETTTNTVLSVAGADAIVDWVLVELRDRNNPATVISRQAALIQRDGDIVAVDGVSSLSFNLPFDSYYIAVKHRNHLGVMTKTPYALSSTPVLVDFTSTSVDNYKLSGVTASDYAQKVASNGKRLLWASNVQKEGNVYRVIYQGPNNEVTPVFIDILTDPLNVGLNANFIKNGYLRSDVTMDGRTIYQGPSNEVDVIYFEVITHPENTSIGANFIINQQIP